MIFAGCSCDIHQLYSFLQLDPALNYTTSLIFRLRCWYALRHGRQDTVTMETSSKSFRNSTE